MATEQKKPKATQIITDPIRIFFVHVLSPKPNDQGKLKFQAQGLIPKSNTALIARMKPALQEAQREWIKKFAGGEKTPEQITAIIAGLRMPMRDGDAEFALGVSTGGQEGKTDPDYKGHYFFNSSSSNKPGVVDADGQPIVDAAQVYSGMFARLIINFYPYNTAGNKGVAVGLNGLQKIRDGEPKAGIGSVGEIFGRYDTGDARDVGDNVGF